MAKTVKPVKITETVLRDGQQSLIATRMTTEQMLPIIDKMDKVGYYAVEMLGRRYFRCGSSFPEGRSVGASSQAERWF